jgi:hypothetical protein
MRPVKITFGEMRSGGGPTGILAIAPTAASAALISDRILPPRGRDHQLNDALLPLLIWVQCFLFGLQLLDELLETLKG